MSFIIVANSSIVCSSGFPMFTGDVISERLVMTFFIQRTRVHETDKAIDKIIDVLEASCLLSTAVNRDIEI